MPEQQIDIVTHQFESQLAHYTSEKRGAGVSPVVTFLAESKAARALLTAAPNPRICEFGGADGLLLGAIRDRLGPNVELTNAELVEAFADRQVHPSIRFIRSSVLDSGFADGSFDVVIARHVLHHLVADSLKGTRENQRRVFGELKRVTRSGGLILIEEHTNPAAISCAILYHLSRFATRIRLDIPAFEVTPYTIVAFLPAPSLLRLAAEGSGGGIELLSERFQPVPMPRQWRLTLLRRNSGNLFAAWRVRASGESTSHE